MRNASPTKAQESPHLYSCRRTYLPHINVVVNVPQIPCLTPHTHTNTNRKLTSQRDIPAQLRSVSSILSARTTIGTYRIKGFSLSLIAAYFELFFYFYLFLSPRRHDYREHLTNVYRTLFNRTWDTSIRANPFGSIWERRLQTHKEGAVRFRRRRSTNRTKRTHAEW